MYLYVSISMPKISSDCSSRKHTYYTYKYFEVHNLNQEVPPNYGYGSTRRFHVRSRGSPCVTASTGRGVWSVECGVRGSYSIYIYISRAKPAVSYHTAVYLELGAVQSITRVVFYRRSTGYKRVVSGHRWLRAGAPFAAAENRSRNSPVRGKHLLKSRCR